MTFAVLRKNWPCFIFLALILMDLYLNKKYSEEKVREFIEARA